MEEALLSTLTDQLRPAVLVTVFSGQWCHRYCHRNTQDCAQIAEYLAQYKFRYFVEY